MTHKNIINLSKVTEQVMAVWLPITQKSPFLAAFGLSQVGMK